MTWTRALSIGAIIFAATIIAAGGWVVFGRSSALSAACKLGLPNFSRPVEVPEFMVGCAVLGKPERLAGTVLLDHHGGALITKGANRAIAFIWNDSFGREPLYRRFVAEEERAFSQDCVTAVSVEAVGRLAETPGDRWGDRKFFVEHLIAVGPPERDVIARVPKNLPPEQCPHTNGS